MTPEEELLHLAHQARLGVFHLDDGPTLEALNRFAWLVLSAYLQRRAAKPVGELSGVFEQRSES